jgi:hypothetical protein
MLNSQENKNYMSATKKRKTSPSLLKTKKIKSNSHKKPKPIPITVVKEFNIKEMFNNVDQINADPFSDSTFNSIYVNTAQPKSSPKNEKDSSDNWKLNMKEFVKNKLISQKSNRNSLVSNSSSCLR